MSPSVDELRPLEIDYCAMEALAHCKHFDPPAVIRVRSLQKRLCAPTVYDPSTVGGADRQRQAEPVLGNTRQLLAEPCPLHRIGARLDHQASADPRLTLTADERRRHAGHSESAEHGTGRRIRHVLRRYLAYLSDRQPPLTPIIASDAPISFKWFV
jgi:hypothetical protein